MWHFISAVTMFVLSVVMTIDGVISFSDYQFIDGLQSIGAAAGMDALGLINLQQIRKD